MGAYNIFRRTKDSLFSDYTELLVDMSNKFVMFKRFDIGRFPNTDIFLLSRFSDLVCRDICHFKCDVEEIRERLNILIIQNR